MFSTDAQLGAIAEVIPGFSERGTVDRQAGALAIVQARDLREDESITWSALARCDDTTGARKAMLRDGDLLVTTRAMNLRTVAIATPPPDVCAGAPFAIVRPHLLQVDPRYLLWFLNSPSTKQRLRACFRGTTMPFLGLRELADFEVRLPPLPRQRAIAVAAAAAQRLSRLAASYEQSVHHLLDAASRVPAP